MRPDFMSLNPPIKDALLVRVKLLAQETVKGTPALASGENRAIALWQAAEVGETKVSELGKAGAAVSIAANAELPAGVVSNGKLFVAYIAKEKEKRSVWLRRV